MDKMILCKRIPITNLRFGYNTSVSLIVRVIHKLYFLEKSLRSK